MQLNTKTKNISDKVQKARNDANIREKTGKKKDQNTKNIAQLIHQSGEGTRFIEEVRGGV